MRRTQVEGAAEDVSLRLKMRMALVGLESSTGWHLLSIRKAPGYSTYIATLVRCYAGVDTMDVELLESCTVCETAEAIRACTVGELTRILLGCFNRSTDV